MCAMHIENERYGSYNKENNCALKAQSNGFAMEIKYIYLPVVLVVLSNYSVWSVSNWFD